jgi:probable rRNA maturation factor
VSFRAELSIDIRNGARVSPSTVRTLRARVGRAMRAAGVAGRAMTISLTDDRELRGLNKKYAGEDHATDVLSFEQGEPAADKRGIPPIRGRRPPLLGDVIISVETAARQAKAAKHSLLAELFHLSVHGMVHLLGYDHATKAEERVMFGYEAKLRGRATRPPRRRA